MEHPAQHFDGSFETGSFSSLEGRFEWATVEEFVSSDRLKELTALYNDGRIRNLKFAIRNGDELVTYETPAM